LGRSAQVGRKLHEQNCLMRTKVRPVPGNATLISTGAISVELHTESVFFGRYRSVFLGIYHTDTDRKLGWYISVSKRGQWPPFSSNPIWKKGGRKGGSDTKKGGAIPTEPLGRQSTLSWT